MDSTVQELQNALFILNNRYTSAKLELEALRGTRKKQKSSSSRILASTFLKKRNNSLQNESPWNVIKSLSTPSGQKKESSKNNSSSEEEAAQRDELEKFQT